MSRAVLDYAARGRPAQVFQGVDVTTPEAGFYRTKLRGGGVLVGVRIWHGPPLDPVTGEELDRSWRWQAQANGELVEFDDVWPGCAGDPITERQYREYAAQQRWAQQHAPDSSFANPRQRHDPLTALLPF